jgi:hypothetical protein
MKNVTVSVPEDVYRRARVYAAAQGRFLSAVVADLLKAWRTMMPNSPVWRPYSTASRQR